MDLNLKFNLIVAALIILVTIFLFTPLKNPLILAVTLSVIINPFAQKIFSKIKKSRKWKDNLVTTGVIILITLIILLFLFWPIYLLINNLQLLGDIFNETFAKIQELIEDYINPEIKIKQWLFQKSEQAVGFVRSVLSGTPELLILVLIFYMVLFFGIRDGHKWREQIKSAMPNSSFNFIEKLFSKSYEVLFAIYVAHISTAFITFIIALPFFTFVVGFSNVFFWSILCALFQLIPIIGPTLIIAVISVYQFSVGDTVSGILLLTVGYPVVAAIPDMIFRPIVMGDRAHVHPLVLWIGFFGGLLSMGLIGFVVGPLMLALSIESFRIIRKQAQLE